MMRVTDVFLAFPFLVALLVVRDVPRWHRRARADHRQDDSSIRFVIVLFVVVRMDGRRAPRAWSGAVAQGARVHRGLASPRRDEHPDHLPPPAAELGRPDPRRADHGGRRRHRRRGDAVASSASARSRVQGRRRSATSSRGRPGARHRATGGWPSSRACCWSLVAICINFIGDGLRDATDPKLPGGATDAGRKPRPLVPRPPGLIQHGERRCPSGSRHRPRRRRRRDGRRRRRVAAPASR